MNEKSEKNDNMLDKAVWLAIAVLFAAGVFANYHYQGIALPLRIIGWIVLFSGMMGLAVMTAQGKRAVAFAREAKIELRKVVWPTRPETIQTTLMVIVLIVVMGLFLWAIDSFLLWLVAWLTGQRG